MSHSLSDDLVRVGRCYSNENLISDKELGRSLFIDSPVGSTSLENGSVLKRTSPIRVTAASWWHQACNSLPVGGHAGL